MITEEQREQRMEQLGSSDMAAVMGVDPWRSAADVWFEKTGKLDERAETEAQYLGNKLEGGVLDFAEEHLGPLERNVFMPCANWPGERLASNLDGRVIENNNPVEAKTSGILYPKPQEWGDEGTDQIPDFIIIQCQVHIFCTGQDICHVPALVGGRGLVMFEVQKQDKIIALIREMAAEFWTKYVIPCTPPPDSTPHLEVLKRVRRIPEKVVDIKPELLQQWRDDKEAAKEAQSIADESQAQLIATLGDAEGGNAGALGMVTYFEQTRKEYVCKASTFRVLRHKKNK